jgi:hypothetical protein
VTAAMKLILKRLFPPKVYLGLSCLLRTSHRVLPDRRMLSSHRMLLIHPKRPSLGGNLASSSTRGTARRVTATPGMGVGLRQLTYFRSREIFTRVGFVW